MAPALRVPLRPQPPAGVPLGEGHSCHGINLYFHSIVKRLVATDPKLADADAQKGTCIYSFTRVVSEQWLFIIVSTQAHVATG
eukprot:457717-Prorocentrum_minimum.AAC.1